MKLMRRAIVSAAFMALGTATAIAADSTGQSAGERTISDEMRSAACEHLGMMCIDGKPKINVFSIEAVGQDDPRVYGAELADGLSSGSGAPPDITEHLGDLGPFFEPVGCFTIPLEAIYARADTFEQFDKIARAKISAQAGTLLLSYSQTKIGTLDSFSPPSPTPKSEPPSPTPKSEPPSPTPKSERGHHAVNYADLGDPEVAEKLAREEGLFDLYEYRWSLGYLRIELSLPPDSRALEVPATLSIVTAARADSASPVQADKRYISIRIPPGVPKCVAYFQIFDTKPGDMFATNKGDTLKNGHVWATLFLGGPMQQQATTEFDITTQ